MRKNKVKVIITKVALKNKANGVAVGLCSQAVTED